MKRITVFIAITLGLLGSIALFLLKDESSLLLPSDLDQYTPQPENAAESFQIILNLSKQFSEEPIKGDPESDEYSDFLKNNRDRIERNFESVEEHLKTVYALSLFEEIGDPTTRASDEIIRFKGIRDFTYSLCEYVDLAYVEGFEDKRLEDLLVWREQIIKWHQHSRVLVHSMIPIVLANRIHYTLSFVAPRAPSEDRDLIQQSLIHSFDFPQSIQRALYSEYCIAATELREIHDGAFPIVRDIEIHINRTLNFYGSYVKATSRLAEERNWKEMAVRLDRLDDQLQDFHLRNRSGWTFLSMAIPASSRVSESAYEAMNHQTDLAELIKNYNK